MPRFKRIDWETGDASQMAFGVFSTGYAIDGTTANDGTYSIKSDSSVAAGSQNQQLESGLTGADLQDMWVRIAFKPTVMGSGLTNFTANCSLIVATNAGSIFQAKIRTASDVPKLDLLYFNPTFQNLLSGVSVSTSVYTRLEAYIHPVAGIIRVWVNDVIQVNSTGLVNVNRPIYSTQLNAVREDASRYIIVNWDTYERGLRDQIQDFKPHKPRPFAPGLAR